MSKKQPANGLVIILALLALAGVIYYAWAQKKAHDEADAKAKQSELELGLAAARMVGAKFEKAAAIKVGTIAGKVVAKAEFKGRIFTPRQETLFPVTVDYFIDVSRIKPNSYHWDADKHVLGIDLPDVTVAKPNIDEAAGVTRQHGAFISREASLAMARQISTRAETKSQAFANETKNLNKARENARAVVTTLALQPLKAARLPDVRVAVSFPWSLSRQTY